MIGGALEAGRNEAAERRSLAGAELDRAAQRHRDKAEPRHFLRGVGAFGGAGADPFEDGAAELLDDHATDEIDGADQPGAARQPPQQMHGAGEARTLAVDLGDVANERIARAAKNKVSITTVGLTRLIANACAEARRIADCASWSAGTSTKRANSSSTSRPL